MASADRTQISTNGKGSSAVSMLVSSLQMPTMELVLQRALYDGSLAAVQATGALSGDSELSSLLVAFPPYSTTSSSRTPQEDFTVVYTGNSEARSEAVRRLTSAFWGAREALQSVARSGDGGSALEDGAGEALNKAVTRLNAGYVLLIATIHTLIDGPEHYLFKPFTELLEADESLAELASLFSDVRFAGSADELSVAARVMFDKFCAEATTPTIHGDAISAIVQSMLIRELKQAVAGKAELAPKLARWFEERMRGEVNTALTNDGKPQPVLTALRRCPAEAKALMNAIVSFSMKDSVSEKSNKGDVLIACEVMLSVGCLIPGTGLVKKLGDMVKAPDLPPEKALIFLSALKFGCHSQDAKEKADPLLLVERAIKILPGLAEADSQRMVRDVLAPLYESFITYFATSPDDWKSLAGELRAECIREVLAPRLVVSKEEIGGDSDRVVPRTVATLLLSHLAAAQAQLGEAATGEEASTEHDASDAQDSADLAEELTRSVAPEIIPSECLQWLVKNIAVCDVSPELCTELVRYVRDQETGFDALREDPTAVTELLLRGGFPTIQLLADGVRDWAWIARMLPHYAPSSDDESLFIQELFKDGFVARLRSLVNSRASTIDSLTMAEQRLMQLVEAQEGLVNERRKAEALELQVRLLSEVLQGYEEYFRVDSEHCEAKEILMRWQSELDELKHLSISELVVRRKTKYKESLTSRVEAQRAKVDTLASRSFFVPQEVKYQLTNWKADQILLGQFHLMQDQLVELQSMLTKEDEALAGQHRFVQDLSEEVATITASITEFFPLLRYACNSPALRAIDLAQFDFQDAGSMDLLGVMCKANLVLAQHRRPAGVRKPGEGATAPEENATPQAIVELGAQLSTALREVFKHASQRPLTLAVLGDLADLAGESCKLYQHWPEMSARGEVRRFKLTALDADVSLLERLYRNLRFDLSARDVSWSGSRMGWDESFHGPVIRIFAGVAADDFLPSHQRRVAVTVALDGLDFEVNRHLAAEQAQIADATLPLEERRKVPTNLVPIPELLLILRDILRVTKACPIGEQRDIERAAEYVRITEWLSKKAISLVEGASVSDFSTLFYSAAKAIDAARKDQKSALLKPNGDIFNFLKAVSDKRTALKDASRSAPPIKPAKPAESMASGLQFDLGIFSSLSLPSVERPGWLRLGQH